MNKEASTASFFVLAPICKQLQELTQNCSMTRWRSFAAMRRPGRAGEGQGALSRQGGRAHRAAEGPGQAAGRGAPGSGRAHQRRPRQQIEAALDGAPRGACRARASTRSWPPRRSTSRCPGAARAPAALHPVTRTLERIETLFRSHRLRCRRRPGDRERLPQLHRAQHPGEPSGARRCTTRSTSTSGHAAAHAHLADAGPLHACADARSAPIRDHRARAASIACDSRRHPFADVPPGRRPVDRRATSASPT